MKIDPRVSLRRGTIAGFVLLVVLLQQSSFPASTDFTFTVHLPAVVKSWPPLALTSVWSSDAAGVIKSAFMPGDALQYVATGFNKADKPLQARLSWSQQDSCGGSSVSDESVPLGTGIWTHYFSTLAGGCLGIYTYTLQLAYEGQLETQSNRYAVNNPSSVVLSTQQGFDKCNIPSVGQMATWWSNSPYYSVNLYVGGISRSCSNSGLDPFWIQAVSKQGWSFIPTWVGPQAPCSGFKYRISENPDVAYLEGRNEAELAALAVDRLGLARGRVIYYDLEGYSPGSLECREAAKAFVKGWVERLHEMGTRAGVYGSPCTSYMNDWNLVVPAPDVVWIASWYTRDYDPDANVWDVPCLSTSLWADHQRIRQYAGDHQENWGGVTFTIDSNALDGEVTYLSNAASTPTSLTSTGPLPLTSPQLESMQPVSPLQGWALKEQSLLWTEDGGLQWKDITPIIDARDQILAVYFLDDRQGWLLERSASAGQMRLLHTQDGGIRWSITPLPGTGREEGSDIQAAYLFFIDESTGWVSLKLASSSNFSLGMLYRTVDGGQTWEVNDLPAGSPVRFVDDLRGWISGGATGDEFYVTEDGGKTWSFENYTMNNSPEEDVKRNLPEGVIEQRFISPDLGWAQLQQGRCTGTKTRPGEATTPGSQPIHCVAESVLLKTEDGGITWEEITP